MAMAIQGPTQTVIAMVTLTQPASNSKHVHTNGFETRNGNGHTKPHTNGHSNGHVDPPASNSKHVHTNGFETRNGNGHTKPHTNGHSNGHVDPPASNSKHVHTNGFEKTNGNGPHTRQDDVPSFSKFSGNTRRLVILPFSGHDDFSLKANISAIAEVAGDYNAVDLAYTLGVRRSKFVQRAFSISSANSPQSALQESSMTFGKGSSIGKTVGFIFTGQGAQWAGMGAELFAEFELYRQSIRSMDAILSKVPEPPTGRLSLLY